MAHQSLEMRAGRGVPDLCYTIGRSRCDPFPVGRYAHLADGGAVASELEARLVVRLRIVVTVWRCGGRGGATSRCLGRTETASRGAMRIASRAIFGRRVRSGTGAGVGASARGRRGTRSGPRAGRPRGVAFDFLRSVAALALTPGAALAPTGGTRGRPARISRRRHWDGVARSTRPRGRIAR